MKSNVKLRFIVSQILLAQVRNTCFPFQITMSVFHPLHSITWHILRGCGDETALTELKTGTVRTN